MKRIKRIFCILVAVAMTLTAFDASAQGQSVRPGKRIENPSKPKSAPKKSTPKSSGKKQGSSSKQSGSSSQSSRPKSDSGSTAQSSPKAAKPRVTVADISNGKRYAIGDVSFVMINVPGGTFTMGATAEQGKDTHDREKPTHSVKLSSYMIGQTEVTQELWQAVMGSNPSYFQGENLPVEEVSWDDCQAFIAKLNQLTGERFRLPTEAEWEYAARGGQSGGTRYSGSENIGYVGWYGGNSSDRTHPIATKQPNRLGIYDMSGNVWEWCQDWYGNYSSSAQTNPQGPSSGSYRVNRGGGWYYDAGSCRVSNRDSSNPSYRGSSLGLRLAR